MSSNCLTSVTIGCLFACRCCNAEKLRNVFTFAPPTPSYTVDQKVTDASGAVRGKLSYALEGLKHSPIHQQAREHAEVHLLNTSLGESIPIVWLRREGAVGTPSLVLLHCHGNATDIGMMMAPYFEFTQQFGIEVVGVEYSGYGASTGRPSSRNTYADVEAAYDHVVASGVPYQRIIAYGQSVGSGPVCGLASKRQLGGIILHSPLMSGIKVIDPDPDKCCRPSCLYHCFDFYPNDQRVKALQCPAFIIHGQLDEVVPFYHGQRLHQMTPKQHQWPGYFPNAGHNDIVETNAEAYFAEVGTFLRGVAQRASSSKVGEPGQMEMSDLTMMGRPCADPVVGPQDGRYQSMRRGKNGPEAKAGSAREIRLGAVSESATASDDTA